MRTPSRSLLQQIGLGCMAGAAISATDNLAFGGEISPIVIVGMLLVGVGIAAAILGRRAVLTAAIIWVWLPAVHLLKHLLGFADTIHPNTYNSILKLGLFALIVSAVGLGIGLGFRRVLHRTATDHA